MTADISLEHVARALSLADFDSREAQLRMAPRPRTIYRPPEQFGTPHQGGVLVLLYPQQGQLGLVLTRRTETLANHRGQISLPGGRRNGSEALSTTAVRETCEELGICLDPDRIIGQLASLYIPPTDFEIHPFVVFHPVRPPLDPAPAEVAEVLEVPLLWLLDPALHEEEMWQIRGLDVQVPFFLLHGHKVWGATAMVLSELENRLRMVLEETRDNDPA
jgi:8-oxo-dGTP pyrophosphatase MutT (NUDIX family)